MPWEVNQADYVSLLYRLDLWEEGYRIICHVLENNQELPSVYFLLSLYHIKKIEWAKAVSALKQTLKLAPEHGAALNNLGVIYALNNEFDAAKKLFQRALDLFPGYLDAIHNLNCLASEQKSSGKDFKFTWRELRPVLLSYSR